MFNTGVFTLFTDGAAVFTNRRNAQLSVIKHTQLVKFNQTHSSVYCLMFDVQFVSSFGHCMAISNVVVTVPNTAWNRGDS
jgi:NADH:ubiquinone oxidoreductase subunit B-like Fe-S oxidoreductase